MYCKLVKTTIVNLKYPTIYRVVQENRDRRLRCKNKN